MQGGPHLDIKCAASVWPLWEPDGGSREPDGGAGAGSGQEGCQGHGGAHVGQQLTSGLGRGAHHSQTPHR